jgi:hypothetical protein
MRSFGEDPTGSAGFQARPAGLNLDGNGRPAVMCRNIKTLFNFGPPATDGEIRAASLQFVRKLSGMNAPSKVNQQAFDTAVEETFEVARRLVHSLVTTAPARDREQEAAKARARNAERYGRA